MSANNINACINKCNNKQQQYTEKCNVACSKPSIPDCKTQCNETQFRNMRNNKRQKICKKGCNKLEFSSESNTTTNAVSSCPNPDATTEYIFSGKRGQYKAPHVKISSIDEISHLTQINEAEALCKGLCRGFVYPVGTVSLSTSRTGIQPNSSFRPLPWS